MKTALLLLAVLLTACGGTPPSGLPVVTGQTTRPGEPMCPDCSVLACAKPGTNVINGVLLNVSKASMDPGVKLTLAHLSAWDANGASDTIVVDHDAMQNGTISLSETDFPSMTPDQKIWAVGEAEMTIKYALNGVPNGAKWTLPVSVGLCK